MSADTTTRTRRSLLAAVAGVGPAFVAKAFGSPESVAVING